MTEQEYYAKLIDIWNSGEKSGVLAVEGFIRKVACELVRADDNRRKAAQAMLDAGQMVSPHTVGQFHRWLDLYPDNAAIDWRVLARGFDEVLCFDSSHLVDEHGTPVLHLSFGFPIGWRDNHPEFAGNGGDDE